MKKIIYTSLLLSLVAQANAQFTIHSVFGNLTDCDTMTRGIYIVWWDHDFNYTGQVHILLDSMTNYRNICLNELGMADPPNPVDGYYYNVYIHTPGNDNDIFKQYGWGNGQGTDTNGYPFLTLPNGVLNDWVNNAHETFHIFQYNGNSPGFEYSGDSQWYIEGTANWFAGKQNLTAPRAWVEAESLVRVPQVPLWLSYNNYPSYYPSNWQRYVHQYASALLMYYLSDVAGVPDNTIVEGFFNGTTEVPQEYLFHTIGPSVFRNDFIDWAAHMTNQFDFILPQQAATNEHEWNDYADPGDNNEFVQVYQNTGSGGWYRPDDSLTTTAWSFNTYKILNTISETYTFEVNGDATGSYGDAAYFQGKVLVQNSATGPQFYDLAMTSDVQGSLTLQTSPSDTAIFFIVASMPETFRDANPVFQTFSYEINITTGVSATSDPNPAKPKIEVARFNLLGQRVNKDFQGIQVIVFDDDSVKKVYFIRD